MMSQLEHPNIVNFVEYFLQDDAHQAHHGACIIVMELLQGPDMMDYIDESEGFSREDAQVCICALYSLCLVGTWLYPSVQCEGLCSERALAYA